MQLPQIFIFITATLFLISCQESNIEKTTEKTATFQFPVIVDTFKFKVDTINQNRLERGTYQLCGIGPLKDTLYMNYFLTDSFRPTIMPPIPSETTSMEEAYKDSAYLKQLAQPIKFDYYLDWRAPNPHKGWWDSTQIAIHVDTTQLVKSSLLFERHAAYPVLVQNLEADTITIGGGDVIQLVMEAKNTLGNWKPIEERFIYGCGTGIGYIILPPKEVALTSALIYQGDFKTQVRLKLGQNYSKPYSMSINPSQFRSQYD